MFKRAFLALAGLLGFGTPSGNTFVMKPRNSGKSYPLPTPSTFAMPSYPFIPGMRQSADSNAFGMSETCRRLVRKNRLRAAGVAGQRC